MALMLLVVLALAGIGFLQIKPTIDNLGQEFSTASQYVPEFNNQLGIISLEEGEKPLYYQSNNFQLVMDDSVVAESDLSSVPLTDQQREAMSTTTPFNLFIFKNVSFVRVLNVLRPIPNQWPFLLNNSNLNVLLNYYNNNSWQVLLPLFFSLFLSHLLLYTIEMLIMALILGLYNMRLSQPLTFGQRFKMATAVSAIPFVALQLLFLFFPIGNVYTWATLVSVIIVYYVFQNHTRFVHDLQNVATHLTLTKDESKDEDSNGDKLSPRQILTLLTKLIEDGEIDKKDLGTGKTIDIEDLKDKYKDELDDIAEEEKKEKEEDNK